MDYEEWIKDIRSGCVNKTKDVIFSSKYVSELADFIEQQAKQIESMKCCENCEHEFVANYKEPCDSCNNFEKWQWDKGSDSL